ncbi:alanine or glycine:cation symporter, AGCS family [Tranquillimonas rosea]|uniref:Alanine or glycine:cation symporter, AGCS family n=1 Tax=Tranquillimonas rosea TaxID=641238 RepID=A0A1H9WUH9_9RHOB|nr:sodium:alanine symporter family protein [Tranquillimonas rosea]SES37494.1 alanine or glycine:cation symporter, AGCS family [Tranquillimonas rosea]
MEDILSAISGFVWGAPLLILLLGTGIYLTVGLRALPVRRLGYGVRMMWGGRRPGEGAEGEITPFQALMTSLSATIGTGNIAGVATAIYLGGPGAVFWMWLTALVGMATKYAEAVLAVTYRETDSDGRYVGGPMYYIRNGLGSSWAWLGATFAFFAMIAAFGIGNTVQSNSVAQALEGSFGLPTLVTGLVLALLTFAVIVGGVRRIGAVAERLVPLMAALYILGALVILLVNIADVPAAFATIFGDAFTGTAATGGFAGAGLLAAIRFGVARGVFSNEAGLGSAPIAHAAAQTRDPVRQGTVAMLGTFIDTIVVCTMTALVIITTGAWTSGETGAELSALAFENGLPGGDLIVTLGLVVFAVTTILGWSYYGERAAEYLFGTRIIMPFRLLWVVALVVGAIGNLGIIWLVADIMNALMALPNLIALIALSGTVFAVSRRYFETADD